MIMVSGYELEEKHRKKIVGKAMNRMFEALRKELETILADSNSGVSPDAFAKLTAWLKERVEKDIVICRFAPKSRFARLGRHHSRGESGVDVKVV